MRARSILETIGHTPHVRINRLFGGTHEVWIKLESFNPLSSIKDRIAFSMIEDAEEKKLLRDGSVIIEPTSGNTGIGLAMVGAVKGYRVVLVMPESMSIERRRAMLALGAEIVLTPKERGMRGAIERAKELVETTPGAWMPMQFDNPANVDVHRKTTAQEILKDFPEGIDYLITGVGTGGHITGCAEVLKEHFRNLKVFAVEPTLSPVLSGGEHSPHPLQGIGAGFVPSILRRDLIDGIILVDPADAFSMAKRAAKEEGIFLGASSGASLAAVAQKIPEIPPASRILTFCYDTGERYLSVPNLFQTEEQTGVAAATK